MGFTDRQVARGRKLVVNLSKCKWELGDLALEVMPAVANPRSLEHRTSPELTELERFAEAIDISYDSLSAYRRIAMAFPRDKRRDDVVWAVHRTFAARDDRFKVLRQRKHWTYDTAEAFVRRDVRQPDVPAGQGGFSEPVSRETRERIVREALNDPETLQPILKDRQVRTKVFSATTQASQRAIEEEARQRREQYPPTDDELAEEAADLEHKERQRAMATYLEMQGLISHARRDLIGAAERWAQVAAKRTDEAVEAMTEDLDKIINSADVLKESIQTGVSADQALAAILEEGV